MALFKTYKKIKTALCLGGGGARGFAHVGAIKAFEEAGLRFDLVAGTSVGSLVGGLYASGINSSLMAQLGDELEPKQLRSGFTPNDPLKIGAIIKKIVGDKRVEDCMIPLYIVAVDLVSARQIIIDKGLLYEAVSASCAAPIFFKPFIKGRMHLADGGLLNNIPADVCRMMGADNVITVDINHTRGTGTESMGFMDVAKATFSIMSAAASREGLINSDIIIAPDLSRYSATKKEGHDEMMQLGYEAAKEKIPQIKELMGIKIPKVKIKKSKRAEEEGI